jgi:hypothetical protein
VGGSRGDICLNVSTTTHYVYGAKCNAASKTEAIRPKEYGTSGAYQLEFLKSTKGCIYEHGARSPVEWHACNINNPRDRWILSIG